jgi:hypothetical protein
MEALELPSGSITVSQFVIVFTNYGHPSRLNTNFQTKIYTSFISDYTELNFLKPLS